MNLPLTQLFLLIMEYNRLQLANFSLTNDMFLDSKLMLSTTDTTNTQKHQLMPRHAGIKVPSATFSLIQFSFVDQPRLICCIINSFCTTSSGDFALNIIKALDWMEFACICTQCKQLQLQFNSIVEVMSYGILDGTNLGFYFHRLFELEN